MKWVERVDKKGRKRMHHACAAFGSMIIVHGGYDDEVR
jgi:hypothetical protein